MIKHEDYLSRNLRELNSRYLKEYNSHRRSNVFTLTMIFFRLLLHGRFSVLKMLIEKRVTHSGIIEKKNYNDYDSYPDDVKVVVYTCIIGGYDTLKEPMYVNKSSCKYFVITDQNVPEDSLWEKIDVCEIQAPSGLDAGTLNRWVKLHPHILFPDYDYSVYIDGSFQLISDIMPIIGAMNEEQWLAIHNMYDGIDDIYDYAKTVVYAKKAPQNVIKKQVEFYKREGYPKHNGIFQNAILFRKHNQAHCKKVMDDWWEQLCMFSKRDQMSLNYILWKNLIKKSEILIIPGTQYNDPFFYYGGHEA